MKPVVLTLRFLSELALLAILAWWGSSRGGSAPAGVALGLGAAVAAAAVWGRWIGPKAGTRLADPARLVVEVVLFGLAALALWDTTGEWGVALAFLGVALGLAALTRRVGEPVPAR